MAGLFVACVYYYVYYEHTKHAIKDMTLHQGKHRINGIKKVG